MPRAEELIKKGFVVGRGLFMGHYLGGKTIGEQLERSLKELCNTLFAFLRDDDPRIHLFDGLLRAVSRLVRQLDLSSYGKLKGLLLKDLLALAVAAVTEIRKQVELDAPRSMGAQVCAAGFLALLDRAAQDETHRAILEYELRAIFRQTVDWVLKQQWLSSLKVLDVEHAARWGVHLEPEAALRHGVVVHPPSRRFKSPHRTRG